MSNNKQMIECDVCHRQRTVQDFLSYSPLQVILRETIGWYSGDDGEICPEDMIKMIGEQR